MEQFSIKIILFTFLGGLGLFLFSVKYMGDGLKLMAGDKIRYVLDKYTTNPFLGVLVGIFVTCLLQSSSATTVITVGLVSVGLLTLRQAIGIVMGANIGTTVTSFIIGFNLSELSLPIIFIGAALLFFTSNQKLNNIGRFLFGFGGLFFALKIMSDAMIPLRDLEVVREFLVKVSQSPLYGVGLGTGLTVLIQSSAATIGILQNLYNDGIISLRGALPILFGDNIGTTITAILAVIGASVEAKRVALSHVLFNVIGTIIFVILLSPVEIVVRYVAQVLNLNPKLQIAFSHGLFNVVNTIILFPFIGVFVYVVTKAIPQNPNEEIKKEKYLDKTFIYKSPIIAIAQAQKELMYMYNLSKKTYLMSVDFFIDRKQGLDEKIEKKETLINQIDMELTDYLSEIFTIRISEKESELVSSYLDITRDIERIGDHAHNLSREVKYQISKKMEFSVFANEEIKTINDTLLKMFDVTYSNLTLENPKEKVMKEFLELHNEIYVLEKKYRKNHIERMKNQQCTIKAGMHYVDVLNHLTRVGDHLKNINDKI